MRKYWKQIITAALLFGCIGLLVGRPLQAQNIKIGDIELSDSFAKEYLLDCYNRPDTIQTPISCIEGDWYWRKERQSIKCFYERRGNDKYGKRFDKYIIVPREPSAWDFMMYMNRKYKSN